MALFCFLGIVYSLASDLATFIGSLATFLDDLTIMLSCWFSSSQYWLSSVLDSVE